jgi:hypothetical protein
MSRKRSSKKKRLPQERAAQLPEGVRQYATPVRRLVPTALIILVALSSTITSIANQFAQDDRAIILEDARMRDISLWSRFVTGPYWPPPYPPEQYRPVTSLWLSLQYVLGLGSPIAFRVVSWIVYATICVALYRFALRVLPAGIALGIAVLFAAHPVHVEVTALGVGQAEMIVAVCSLLAAILYHSRRVGEASLRARDWIAIAVLYAVAALAKEQGFLLPILLLLVELTMVQAALRERIRAVWPGYLALGVVAVGILVLNAVVLGENLTPAATNEVLAGKGLAVRALSMLGAVPEWIRLLVWPAHLRVDYSPQEFVAATRVGGRELLGLGALVSLGVAAWVSRRRAPAIALGTGWIALTLLPVSNILVLTGVYIAERTMFQPSIGFVLALGGAATLIASRIPSGWKPLGQPIAITLVALATVLGVARSAIRQRVWRDDYTLAQTAALDSPRSWRAHADLAGHLLDRGELSVAMKHYRLSTDFSPTPWIFRKAFARRLRSVGKDTMALAELRESIKEKPDQPDAVAELIAALLAVGHYQEARTLSDDIIRLHNAPPLVVALRQLSDSAMRTNAPVGSIRIAIPVAVRQR